MIRTITNVINVPDSCWSLSDKAKCAFSTTHVVEKHCNICAEMSPQTRFSTESGLTFLTDNFTRRQLKLYLCLQDQSKMQEESNITRCSVVSRWLHFERFLIEHAETFTRPRRIHVEVSRNTYRYANAFIPPLTIIRMGSLIPQKLLLTCSDFFTNANVAHQPAHARPEIKTRMDRIMHTS